MSTRTERDKNSFDVLERETEAPSTEQPSQPEDALPNGHMEEDHPASFWKRLSAIPIIHDGLAQVEQHALSRFAMRRAESTLSVVAAATPAMYLEKANAVGVRSLDLLETRFPVVRQPVSDVLNSFKDSVRTYLRGHRPQLQSLNETHRWLHETTTGLANVSASLQYWVKYSQTQLKEHAQAKARQRALDLTTEMIQRLDRLTSYLNHLPPSSYLTPLVELATNEYEIIRKEATKPDLALHRKATNIVRLTQGLLLPALRDSIDGVQEQIRSYFDYVGMPKNKCVPDDKKHLSGVRASS
ncbi:hypothetical protein BCR43DRAFT_482011 [Syncephalastrum racemosum]|uniref:Perilipin family-domain-containing protein n=1 Tax=Syncephalastrum racemosum TaxID=13706 RepID=A0A1X2HT75_SYNRA|nr:hypothetical protein BCR43DRAFT_482011 [Syncephalastrum racemosum]